MDIYEQAVMTWLANDGKTFTSPQFELGGGWSRPDFVAIQPSTGICLVAEVTTHGAPRDLLEKVVRREEQWLVPLRKYFSDYPVQNFDWTYGVVIFVRTDCSDWCNRKVGTEPDVKVVKLEHAFTHWTATSIAKRERLNTWAENLRKNQRLNR